MVDDSISTCLGFKQSCSVAVASAAAAVTVIAAPMTFLGLLLGDTFLLLVLRLLLFHFFLSTLPMASHAIRCMVAFVFVLAMAMSWGHCMLFRVVSIGLAMAVTLSFGHGVLWVMSLSLAVSLGFG